MFPTSMNFVDIALSLPLETLEALLKSSNDLVSCTGYGGLTALHKAVYVGNFVVAVLLLKNGADPNTPTATGDTSVHIACSKGSLKLLVTLLNYKGDLHVTNKTGHLPLHCAAQSGSLVIVQFLSEVYHLNLETPDRDGVTVLHAACAGGHIDLVRFLLDIKKVFCLNVDSKGNTVLHSGATGGLSGVCWCIVSHGGESLLLNKNKQGQTPLHIAQSSLTVSQDCKKWLEKWTLEFEKRKSISSPKFQLVLLLLTPFLIYHLGIILSAFLISEKQWAISILSFLILLFIIKKQEHRISHPSRLANPIFVGAYFAGLVSSLTSYSLFYGDKYFVPSVLYYGTIGIYIIQIYFLVYLIKKDPGKIPQTFHVKDALQKLSEDRLEDRYCPQCFVSAPTVSHHCRLCERCVLHLDHHCLFLNTCIGANNHWHFVIFVLLNIITMTSFIMTCVVYMPSLKANSQDWMQDRLAYWLCNDMWTLTLLICNGMSLMWGLSLLRYQIKVIGTQQTTYHRIKCGEPSTSYSMKQKFTNFILFLFHKKITLKSSSHYLKV